MTAFSPLDTLKVVSLTVIINIDKAALKNMGQQMSRLHKQQYLWYQQNKQSK